jgi:hypothetical protein
LISRLHNDNVASIKTFGYITGIKLSRIYKERRIQLETITKADYTEQPKQYKPRKNSVEADYNSVFYMKNRGGDGKTVEFVESRGRLWNYGGYEFFIVVDEQGKMKYSITEGKTGLIAARGTTLKEAQDSVRELVNREGTPSQRTFADIVTLTVERDGISPLYQTDLDIGD